MLAMECGYGYNMHMTETVGTLLKGSWSYFTAHAKPILIAAVVFGVLMFGMQVVFESKTNRSMEQRFGDIDQMEDLAERIEDGDEEAFQEMMMQLGIMGDSGDIDEETARKAASDLIGNMLPMFSVFLLVMMVITIIATTFYTVLAIEGSQDFMVTLRRVPALILPMLGVWIWSFIRSFAWIPIIGVIFAIVLGPRLVMSSVILIKEQKGVFESVSLSYSRSRGYWGKIVGNCIVGSLAVMLAVFVLSILVELVGTVSVTGAAILAAALQSAATAYGTIFIVRLTNTICANPMQIASKK